MKNTTILLFLGVIVLVIGGFVFASSTKPNGNTITGNAVNNGEIQRITLSTKNYNYYPDTIKVKAGQPVSISLDEKVSGCLRSFTLRDLGISKYLKTAQDTLDFTPTQKGTFKFSCSMGMGYGTLIVE
ncbi:cupredoxin domain-containing protein [Candidatus Pacearchaeota archaeon]|nr:cupredoxin domain-containing protein [Candidatus Pacearchaeota archaeon]